MNMTKQKTYWAVFTGRGSVAIDVANYPLIYIIKAEAENDRLWLEQERGDKKATVRKVHIVEVKK